MNIERTSRASRFHLWSPSGSFRSGYVMSLVLAGAMLSHGEGTVTNSTETALRAALAGGGLVTISCDGILELSQTLTITNDTTIDAAGHDLVLEEGTVIQPFRLFQINPGVVLALNHLTLAKGYMRGTNSEVGNGVGGDGLGGAVWNNGGTLQATDCVFTNNEALGGTGGPGVSGTIAFNFGGGGYGGAIYNDAGTLRLTNVLFVGNKAQGGQGGSAPSPAPSEGGSGGPSYGGAIYSRTGIVTIASCQFISNSAPASVPGPANGYNPNSGPAAAGAVYFMAGTNMILDSQFTSQSVGGGQWFCNAEAGAIYQAAGLFQIFSCSFSTNTVIGGAGIIIGSGSNAGNADGGALFLANLSFEQQGQGVIYCSAVISNSCFVGNRVKGGLQGPAAGAAGTGRGGAVESSALLQMFNCTLTGNSAAGGDITYPNFPLSSAYGGALALNSASILTHVTIAANTVNKGAGAGSSGSSSSVALGGGIYVRSGQIEVRNSIFSSNTPTNCSGTLIDDGNSVSSDASCAFTMSGSFNSTDPLLQPLGAYGGPTLTMPLRPGSPAIDSGNAAFCLPADQRGVPRPQGNGCDMGAVEDAVLTIHRQGNGSWVISQAAGPGAFCTLQMSTGLLNWNDVDSTDVDQSGQAEFVVPDPGSNRVFFRSAGAP